MYYFDGMTTPIGRLHIVTSDDALVRLYLPDETWTARYVRNPKHPRIVETKKQLAEYFAGKRRVFVLSLAPEGTPFQKRAWEVLRKIPYGTTITYAQEAARAGNPRASRAVGSANGKNPLPILIPCHRVIATGGKLGGYAGGLACKQSLLDLEVGR